MSDDVTDVNVKNEPVNVSPGGGMTFDQLEAIENGTANDAAEAVIEEVKAEAVKETIEEVAEEAGEISQAEAVRIIKAMRDGEETELPGNISIKHKDQEFTLADLVDSGMAQADIGRKYTEFDKTKKGFEAEKQKFEQDMATIDRHLKHMAELAKKGDHWGALAFMAEMAGQNPLEYQRGLVDQAMGMAQKFADMNEEQVEDFWKRQESKHVETANQKRIKALEAQVAQKNQQEAVRSVIAKAGITEEQFTQAYTFLKDNNQLENLSGLTEAQATERICDFYRDSVHENTILTAIKEVKPELAKNEKLVDKLFRFTDYGDTTEDIKDILNEYLGFSGKPESEVTEDDEEEPEAEPEKPAKETQSKKAAPKKAASSKKAASKGKKKETKPKPEDSEDDANAVGFDDILEQYGRG